MPWVYLAFTVSALGMMGVPGGCGFISKWYLAEGALQAEVGIFRWIGPVILLLSALLTAGYLLPVVMNGFFPGKELREEADKQEPHAAMLIPLIVLAALALVLGIWPNPLIEYVRRIAVAVM